MQEGEGSKSNRGFAPQHVVRSIRSIYPEGARKVLMMKTATLFESDIVREPLSAHSRDRLHATLTTLIDRLDSPAISQTDVIRWGCPVPSFGDLSNARVATIGLNPSNREFVDESGNELEGSSRRFHTLTSLGLASWAEADARHLRLILESCRAYFLGNPYDTWFKRLDYVIHGARASFYDPASVACHLDL